MESVTNLIVAVKSFSEVHSLFSLAGKICFNRDATMVTKKSFAVLDVTCEDSAGVMSESI